MTKNEAINKAINAIKQYTMGCAEDIIGNTLIYQPYEVLKQQFEEDEEAIEILEELKDKP